MLGKSRAINQSDNWFLSSKIELSEYQIWSGGTKSFILCQLGLNKAFCIVWSRRKEEVLRSTFRTETGCFPGIT